MSAEGTLFVVATPIGNLKDFSLRAIDVLREVSLVLAEDTRSFGRLAQHFGIETPSLSFHEHNEKSRIDAALERLQDGEQLALVSEAGTPTISDPGYRLVLACRERDIAVTTVPGACAAVAALSISGFETNAFSFFGFLPHKDGKRRAMLEDALARTHPTIFYESPYRIVKSIAAIAQLDETRDVFIARELTKMYEETLRGPAGRLLAELQARSSIKGEIVLIVRGTTKARVASSSRGESE